MEDWHTYLLLVGKDKADEKLLESQIAVATSKFRKLDFSRLDENGMDIYFSTVHLVIVKVAAENANLVAGLRQLILANRDRILLFVEDVNWDAAEQGFEHCAVVRTLQELIGFIEFRLCDLRKA